jgi:hypothetical protein
MKDLLPQRMLLTDPNGKDTKAFVFDTIARNTSWSADPFSPQLVKGWQVIRNPVGDQQQPGGAPAGRPGRGPMTRRRSPRRTTTAERGPGEPPRVRGVSW